jgi:hypothetical protein
MIFGSLNYFLRILLNRKEKKKMKSGTVPGFRPKATVPGAAWAGGLLWQLGARARRGAVTAGRVGAVARVAMGR